MTSPVPELRFDADGLIPAVIQDAESGAVLMVAFMNAEALRLTRETGRTHFWSRSRGKLWRKGETSGNEQVVEELFVNCELNSLLIAVRQSGAVCHDGYPTCYYRRLEDDGQLTVVGDRWFDPVDVYGDGDGLAGLTRRWYGAYEFLRDHDLSAVSSTSKRLRAEDAGAAERVADELRELAGVLDGSHRHGAPSEDLLLEGSQVLYWTAVAAVSADVGWERLRPDRALDAESEGAGPETVARLLRAEAPAWSSGAVEPLAERVHATMTLVAQACAAKGLPPRALIERDLAQMRERPYLAPYFEEAGSA